MKNYYGIFLLFCLFCISNNQKLPMVINTWAFTEATKHAWQTLNVNNGSALDAVEVGCSTCEALQCDGTVGFGGSPDEKGETTLDAMIMTGIDMNIGAVAALRRIKNAVSVARHVLEYTQHTLLVGDQATQFAIDLGFQEESLTTSASHTMWKNWKKNQCQPNFWMNVQPNPKTQCGPYKPETFNDIPRNDKEKSTYFGTQNHDTIGIIAIDAESNIVAGTSTNGARNKIPGRVGDSPIPGAGAYADNDVGAAAATGDGDIMMRFLPSFLAVEELRKGNSPTKSAQIAIERIIKRHSKFFGGIIVVNKFGDYGAACRGMDKFPFSVVNKDLGSVTIATVSCTQNKK